VNYANVSVKSLGQHGVNGEGEGQEQDRGCVLCPMSCFLCPMRTFSVTLPAAKGLPSGWF